MSSSYLNVRLTSTCLVSASWEIVFIIALFGFFTDSSVLNVKKNLGPLFQYGSIETDVYQR